MALLKTETIRIISNQQAFVQSVKRCLENQAPHRMTLEDLVYTWWCACIGSDLPEDGLPFFRREINDIIRIIQVKLLEKGFRSVNKDINTVFIKHWLVNFNIDRPVNFSLIREESIMATKKKSKVETVTSKKSVDKKEKTPRPKGATGYVCELLMERKFTDEELIEKVQGQYPDRTEKQIKVYLSVQRAEINAGRKAGFKLGKSDKPLERLVRHEGVIVPYSQAPKKSTAKKEKKMLKKHTNIDPGKKGAVKKKAVTG